MNLSEKTDSQLIDIIKETNSSEAYLELKKRNEKSYYRTCERFTKKVPLLKYEELIEDCDFVLNKAIKSFKSNKKVKFSSWHTNHCRYHILNTIKKLTEIGHFIPMENTDIDLLNNAFNKYHVDNREDLKEHVFSILDKIQDKRIKKIFELRYYNDKQGQKWHNIAKEMNLTTQQCSNLFQRGRALLYKNIKNENKKNHE